MMRDKLDQLGEDKLCTGGTMGPQQQQQQQQQQRHNEHHHEQRDKNRISYLLPMQANNLSKIHNTITHQLYRPVVVQSNQRFTNSPTSASSSCKQQVTKINIKTHNINRLITACNSLMCLILIACPISTSLAYRFGSDVVSDFDTTSLQQSSGQLDSSPSSSDMLGPSILSNNNGATYTTNQQQQDSLSVSGHDNNNQAQLDNNNQVDSSLNGKLSELSSSSIINKIFGSSSGLSDQLSDEQQQQQQATTALGEQQQQQTSNNARNSFDSSAQSSASTISQDDDSLQDNGSGQSSAVSNQQQQTNELQSSESAAINGNTALTATTNNDAPASSNSLASSVASSALSSITQILMPRRVSNTSPKTTSSSDNSAGSSSGNKNNNGERARSTTSASQKVQNLSPKSKISSPATSQKLASEEAIIRRHYHNTHGHRSSSASQTLTPLSHKRDDKVTKMHSDLDQTKDGSPSSHLSSLVSGKGIIKAMTDNRLARTMSTIGKSLAGNKYVTGAATASAVAALGYTAFTKLFLPYLSLKMMPAIGGGQGVYPGLGGQLALATDRESSFGSNSFAPISFYHSNGQPSTGGYSTNNDLAASSSSNVASTVAGPSNGYYAAFYPAFQTTGAIRPQTYITANYPMSANQQQQQLQALLGSYQQTSKLNADLQQQQQQYSPYRASSEASPSSANNNYDVTITQQQQQRPLFSGVGGQSSSADQMQVDSSSQQATYLAVPTGQALQQTNGQSLASSYSTGNGFSSQGTSGYLLSNYQPIQTSQSYVQRVATVQPTEYSPVVYSLQQQQQQQPQIGSSPTPTNIASIQQLINSYTTSSNQDNKLTNKQSDHSVQVMPAGGASSYHLSSLANTVADANAAADSTGASASSAAIASSTLSNARRSGLQLRMVDDEVRKRLQDLKNLQRQNYLRRYNSAHDGQPMMPMRSQQQQQQQQQHEGTKKSTAAIQAKFNKNDYYQLDTSMQQPSAVATTSTGDIALYGNAASSPKPKQTELSATIKRDQNNENLDLINNNKQYSLQDNGVNGFSPMRQYKSVANSASSSTKQLISPASDAMATKLTRTNTINSEQSDDNSKQIASTNSDRANNR